ncbi:hypothetical protein Tco_0702235 [Tanacetum coccineum]|uniref:Uncharacterized protein n=1 Tax=Tanacetum coccineum TaxID=301880 RepID=A0ABQ4XVE2_9ASTR
MTNLKPWKVELFTKTTYSGRSNLFMVRRLGMLKAYDRKSEASHKFRLEASGNGLGHNLFSVGPFYDSDLEQLLLRATLKTAPSFTNDLEKTPYELINGKKPDISFLHVFKALCYPKNDREDIGKIGAKAMAFEQHSSKPRLQGMTFGQISSGLDLTYAPSIITSQNPTEWELDLLFKAMYDDYIGGQPSAAPRTASAA